MPWSLGCLGSIIQEQSQAKSLTFDIFGLYSCTANFQSSLVLKSAAQIPKISCNSIPKISEVEDLAEPCSGAQPSRMQPYPTLLVAVAAV